MAISVMLDLETWGKKPGCDLRSIGATVFDPITGTVGKECRACNGGRGPGNVNDGGGEFYVATDNPRTRIDGPPEYPLTRDPGTVQWWSEQSDEAQAAFADPVDLRDALMQFGGWLRDQADDCGYQFAIDQRVPDDVALWSHGPAFDVAILAAAYDAVGLPVPWHYRAPRDTRTAFDMAGIDDHSAWLQRYSVGTLHNALDDAISQARAVCGAYARLHAR